MTKRMSSKKALLIAGLVWVAIGFGVGQSLVWATNPSETAAALIGFSCGMIGMFVAIVVYFRLTE